jgi:hypothetical protein
MPNQKFNRHRPMVKKYKNGYSVIWSGGKKSTMPCGRTAVASSFSGMLLIALTKLAERFFLEKKTTLNYCTCLQFEDNDECRHTEALNLLKIIEIEMGKLTN